MSGLDVAAEVRAAVSFLAGGEPAEDAMHLTSDLGLDSLDQFELMMRLEDRLGVTVSDDDWEHVKTVGDAIRLGEAKRAAKGGAG